MKFIVTGTQAYGPVGPNSDLDIVIMRNDVELLSTFLKTHDIEPYITDEQKTYGNNGGFYFDLSGIKINIIIVDNEDEFNKWKRNTERMRTLSPIEDRQERIEAFRDEAYFWGIII